jgi:hypothetical protein
VLVLDRLALPDLSRTHIASQARVHGVAAANALVQGLDAHFLKINNRLKNNKYSPETCSNSSL